MCTSVCAHLLCTFINACAFWLSIIYSKLDPYIHKTENSHVVFKAYSVHFNLAPKMTQPASLLCCSNQSWLYLFPLLSNMSHNCLPQPAWPSIYNMGITACLPHLHISLHWGDSQLLEEGKHCPGGECKHARCMFVLPWNC